MSAPVIWVVVPILAALGLLTVQKKTALCASLATSLCAFLAVLALLLPFEEAIRVGSLSLRIEPVFLVAGRRFVLDSSMRPVLAMMYSLAAFWLAGTVPSRSHRLHVSFGLASVSLLVASLAVEPILYAALLIEGAVLLTVPMLIAPGQPSNQGVLRYLIFQSLAMPVFILGSWALTGVEGNPTDNNLVVLTGIFVGLAFALWLAVFPLYTWAPLLSGQAQPYTAGFIFLLFPTTCLLLGVKILSAHGWLHATTFLYDVLRLSGGMMVITAGFWAAFQRDLGRLFGYVVIVQTGFSLLALCLDRQLGNEIFMMMFLPRLIGLGLWSLSASVIRQHSQSLQFIHLDRAAERAPAAVIGLVVAFLSLAGLPLLAEFPIRVVLLQEISTQHPIAALGVLLGSMGLLFSGFRLLAVFTGGNLGLQRIMEMNYGETRLQIFLIGAGVMMLLVVGLFPRTFFPLMIHLLGAFSLGS